MLRSILFSVAMTCAAATAQAATYDPFGPQNDVAKSDVLGGGWSIIYSGAGTDANVDLASIFAQAGDMVMIATAQTGSRTFDLLASISSSIFVPLQTARNATVQSNGAEWYKNGYSLGFAAAGDVIRQNSADVERGVNSDQRMSWHTNFAQGQNPNAAAVSLGSGYRSGDAYVYNGWERFVLTKDVSPVPVPASLPLLVAGLGGLVLLRRKKPAA